MIRLHNRCLCIRHRAFLYTGAPKSTNSTLCTGRGWSCRPAPGAHSQECECFWRQIAVNWGPYWRQQPLNFIFGIFPKWKRGLHILPKTENVDNIGSHLSAVPVISPKQEEYLCRPVDIQMLVEAAFHHLEIGTHSFLQFEDHLPRSKVSFHQRPMYMSSQLLQVFPSHRLLVQNPPWHGRPDCLGPAFWNLVDRKRGC